MWGLFGEGDGACIESVGNVWRGGWGRYRECGECLERGMGQVRVWGMFTVDEEERNMSCI